MNEFEKLTYAELSRELAKNNRVIRLIDTWIHSAGGIDAEDAQLQRISANLQELKTLSKEVMQEVNRRADLIPVEKLAHDLGIPFRYIFRS